MDVQVDNQRFTGSHHHPAIDAWFKKQHKQIRALMLDGRWRTLDEIEGPTGVPAASVFAHLLILREPEFGDYYVEKRPRGQNIRGPSEFRISTPDEIFGSPLDSFSEADGRAALAELRTLVAWAKDRGYPTCSTIIRLGRWMRCIYEEPFLSANGNGTCSRDSDKQKEADDAQYQRILAQNAWLRELEEQMQSDDEAGELTA